MRAGAVLRVTGVPGEIEHDTFRVLRGGSQGCLRAPYLGLLGCLGNNTFRVLRGGPGMRARAVLRVTGVPGE